METKASATALLREVANAVERGGELRVIAALRAVTCKGVQHQLQLGVVTKSKSKGGASNRAVRHEVVSLVSDRLRSLESRKDGLQAIDEANLSRRELEAVARHFDVPVRKDVRVPDLEELVVNVTIGARSNSRAIRGDAR